MLGPHSPSVLFADKRALSTSTPSSPNIARRRCRRWPLLRLFRGIIAIDSPSFSCRASAYLSLSPLRSIPLTQFSLHATRLLATRQTPPQLRRPPAANSGE